MNKQYRVMVVEDEQIERDALAMMLRYKCAQVGEIATAENGIAALETLKRFQPDIALVDISLPGINGLETIQQMRSIVPNLQFVITSAHNQFAYAQEALRLGVYDFLVKPIASEDMIRVIGKVIEQIEQSQSRREHIQLEKITSIRPLLETDAVFSIASMRSDSPIDTLFDFLQIKVVSVFVFLVDPNGHGSALLKAIKHQVGSVGLKCLGEIINELCVFVALNDSRISQKQIREIIQYVSTALIKRDMTCRIGVGEAARCADDLRISYEQAIQAVRYAMLYRESLVFYTDIQNESTEENPAVVSTRIIKAIRTGDSIGLQEEVSSFLSALRLDDGKEESQRDRIRWLYEQVYIGLPELQLETDSDMSITVPENIGSNISIDSLLTRFMEMLETLRKQDPRQNSPVVFEAVEIVNQRFMENLTLESIAEELHFSMFYLSKLFKRQMGVSFTEYLTQYRIEKAKRFLNGGDYTIKEAAYASGFNSQGYFSKVFRKYTGVSPSDYIRLNDNKSKNSE